MGCLGTRNSDKEKPNCGDKETSEEKRECFRKKSKPDASIAECCREEVFPDECDADSAKKRSAKGSLLLEHGTRALLYAQLGRHGGDRC